MQSNSENDNNQEPIYFNRPMTTTSTNNPTPSPFPFFSSSKSHTHTEIIHSSNFYNGGQRDPGEEGRKASRVLFLRSFNNWVKAVLINKYCYLLGINLSVLDLCCGRGGDLKKYFRTKVKLYVGSDLSRESLRNAKDRITKIRNERYNSDFSCKCFLIPEDLSHPDNHLMEKIQKNFYFDLVSCQFAMHYHFESEKRARAFLKNVVARLCDGGFFIGSIVDDNVIVKRLRHRKYKENKYIKDKYTFGNEYYKIHFEQRTFPKDKGPYGIKYGFFLEDSIDKRDEEGNIKCVGEYLVIFDEFVKLCEEYDLYLVENKNFTNFYEDNLDKYKGMFIKMLGDELGKANRQDQWEIIQLYQVFVMRKGKKEFVYNNNSKGERFHNKKQDNNNTNTNNNNNGVKYIPFLQNNPIKFSDYDPVIIEDTFE